jgi:hypothetical protein
MPKGSHKPWIEYIGINLETNPWRKKGKTGADHLQAVSRPQLARGEKGKSLKIISTHAKQLE